MLPNCTAVIAVDWAVLGALPQGWLAAGTAECGQLFTFRCLLAGRCCLKEPISHDEVGCKKLVTLVALERRKWGLVKRCRRSSGSHRCRVRWIQWWVRLDAGAAREGWLRERWGWDDQRALLFDARASTKDHGTVQPIVVKWSWRASFRLLWEQWSRRDRGDWDWHSCIRFKHKALHHCQDRSTRRTRGCQQHYFWHTAIEAKTSGLLFECGIQWSLVDAQHQRDNQAHLAWLISRKWYD